MLVPHGEHVEFVDGDDAEHIVVLARWRWLFPVRRARRKLGRWKRQGRAFYAEPLTFIRTRRR